MSLSKSLCNDIEKALDSFMDRIASEYNLDKNELQKLWSGEVKTSTKAATKPRKKKDDSEVEDTVDEDEKKELPELDEKSLVKATKADLVAYCRERGLKVSGAKPELLKRLLGCEEPVEKKGKSESKKETKKSKKASAVTATDVVKKLTSDIPVIPIRRNTHGNFSHPETGLVFDRKTESVIGKQNDDGTVSSLTDSDIEQCKKFKLKYTLPDNLDIGNDDVAIQELDGNSDSDVVEDVVEDDNTVEDDEDDLVVESDEEDEEELYED